MRHILYSNAFQKRRHQDTIRLALISACHLTIARIHADTVSACAHAAGRPDIIVEHSRKLINTHQFNNEPYRLLLASLGSGLRNTDAFLASTLTKHLLREVRANDAALRNPEALRWNPVNKRYGTGGKVEDEDEDAAGEPGAGVSDESQPRPRLPTKENPVGVALYGQICLAAKSYQSALCKSTIVIDCFPAEHGNIVYLLHAYDYCPHDPMICLCLAIASIGRAMQRQADNRHHMITQVSFRRVLLCVLF